MTPKPDHGQLLAEAEAKSVYNHTVCQTLIACYYEGLEDCHGTGRVYLLGDIVRRTLGHSRCKKLGHCFVPQGGDCQGRGYTPSTDLTAWLKAVWSLHLHIDSWFDDGVALEYDEEYILEHHPAHSWFGGEGEPFEALIMALDRALIAAGLMEAMPADTGTCPSCNGTGQGQDMPCPMCRGTGQPLDECGGV